MYTAWLSVLHGMLVLQVHFEGENTVDGDLDVARLPSTDHRVNTDGDVQDCCRRRIAVYR